MPALAEVQTLIRHAVVAKDGDAIVPFLVGGSNPARRLEIYQRHYDATLVTQLLGRFPTIVWLVGSAFVTDAAQAYIRGHLPSTPCLAEYGEGFPAFVASLPGAERVPYLELVGEVDWRLGEVAIAIERMSMKISQLANFAPEALLDLHFILQPGLRYLEANWPIDDLVKLHLSDQAPDRFEFDPMNVYLEIRGARGAFRIGRLDRGTFALRRSLTSGATLGASVETAQASDPEFDPALALTSLFGERLVTRAAS